MLYALLDKVFSPILALNPMVSLTIMAFIISLIVIISYKKLIDKELLMQTKKRMKKLKEMTVEAQKSKDLTKIEVITKEMMKLNKIYLKEVIKPLTVSLLVLIIFFPWMSRKFSGTVVLRLPFIKTTGNFKDIIVGNGLGWVGWYVIVSLTIGWILRKFLGVET